MMHPAKISSGRLCSSTGTGLCDISMPGSGTPPCALATSISRGLNLAKRQQCGREQHGGDDEHRARREEMSGRAHHGGREPVADGRKAGIAAKAFADGCVTDETKADGGDRAGPSTQLAAACNVAASKHRRKDREGRVGEGGDGDRGDGDAGDETARTARRRRSSRRASVRPARQGPKPTKSIRCRSASIFGWSDRPQGRVQSRSGCRPRRRRTSRDREGCVATECGGTSPGSGVSAQSPAPADP